MCRSHKDMVVSSCKNAMAIEQIHLEQAYRPRMTATNLIIAVYFESNFITYLIQFVSKAEGYGPPLWTASTSQAEDPCSCLSGESSSKLCSTTTTRFTLISHNQEDTKCYWRKSFRYARCTLLAFAWISGGKAGVNLSRL